MPEAPEWNIFLTKFRGNLDGDNRSNENWANFLARYKEIYLAQKIITSNLPTKPQKTPTDYKYFISRFAPAIREYFKLGHGFNIWEIARVGCDEMRNSYILKWLLDCNGSHGQGNLFLEGLLDWLAENKQAKEYLPKPGITQNAKYWAKVESLPLGEMESRVDIEIGGPFVLIIEVKVNSQENGNQLERYINAAQHKAARNKTTWGVLYLTRHGSLPDEECLRDHVCSISWGQMAKIINDVTDKYVLRGSFIEHQVRQYCHHIKSL